MRFVCRTQICRVESNYCASEDQLEEAKDPVGDQEGKWIAR